MRRRREHQGSKGEIMSKHITYFTECDICGKRKECDDIDGQYICLKCQIHEKIEYDILEGEAENGK